jgi:tRNA/rRNA methyltransferase
MTPSIILISPQMGENIGATARAMKNFGLSELRIVSPRDGWPNSKADSMSVGAIDIIQNAKIYDNLKDAIEDIEFLYATTGVARAMNKNYVMAHKIGIGYPIEQKVGIMFGRENCGLNNEEIAHANMILSIATNPEFCSLNIAHAVAVVAHAIWNHLSNNNQIDAVTFSKISHFKTTPSQILATRGELEYFFEHLFGELDRRNFFKIPEKYPGMTQNIRNIFARVDNLSKNELQTLRGIITSLSNNRNN